MKFAFHKDYDNRKYINFPASRLITVPSYSDVNFDTGVPFSVSMWVRHLSSAVVRYILSKYDGNTSSEKGWAISTDNTSGRRVLIRFVDGAGGVAQFASGNGISFGATNWGHILYCFKGGDHNSASNHVFYINGAKVTNVTQNTTFNNSISISHNTQFRIGGIGSSVWIGDIDDIMIFNADIDNYDYATGLFGVGLARRANNGAKSFVNNSDLKFHLVMGDYHIYSGTTLTIPNLANPNYNGTSTNLTPTNIVADGAGVKFSNYDKAKEPVKFKNMDTYFVESENWSQNIAKNVSSGTYVGSAQSTKKVIGDFRVHFWIHSAASLRHTYLGFSDSNTAFSAPNSSVNHVAFGAANGGFAVYENSTLVHNGIVPVMFDLITFERIGDNINYKLNGVTQYTTTGANAKFPNGIYVTPIMLYTLNTNRLCWEAWFDFDGMSSAGLLVNNNLI